MDRIKQILIFDYSKLIFLALGYIGGKILESFYKFIEDRIKNLVKEKYRKTKFSKAYEKEAKLGLENLNILSIDHAENFYEYSDIEIIHTQKKFFLDCPQDIKSKIYEKDKNMAFHEDYYFEKDAILEDLATMTRIENLPELIEKHRIIVGNMFLRDLDKAYSIFNGKKFGVYSIKNRRLNASEDAGFHIEFYETDYFTHKVFRSIYKELKDNNHEISKINIYPEEGLDYLRPFMTSFGVNSFIIARTEKGEKGIIFSKRSPRTANTQESIWHVTMNEGLSFTDLEGKDISLINCLYRGLKEELGIGEEHHKLIEREKFLDLFLVKDNFEIGITSLVETTSTMDVVCNLHSIAKDSVLETEELKIVPLNSKEIIGFIQSNKLTTAALYTLKMIVLREKYLFKNMH